MSDMISVGPGIVFVVAVFGLILVGLLMTLCYTCYFAYRYFVGDSEKEEEVPLLGHKDKDDAPSGTLATPVFGEPAWFYMAGLCVMFLSCRCLWQNMSKVIMQLEWADDSSDHRTFRKPLFISFFPMLAMALYFPFCGLAAAGISRRLLETMLSMAALQIGNLLFFMYAVNILPISTAVVVRGGSSMFFVGIFAYYRKQMNLQVASAMGVVLLGTVLGCVSPSIFSSAPAGADSDVVTYLIGLTALILSSLCQTARMALQELTFCGDRRITAVQLSAGYAILACALLVVVAAAAQFTPSPSGGVWEDTIESLTTIASSGLYQPFLALLLILMIVMSTSNLLLLASLVREYGAATTRVLTSLEIFATWIFAVCLYYLFAWLNIDGLHGIGEAFDLSESYLKIIAGILIILGTELYLRSRRQMMDDSEKK